MRKCFLYTFAQESKDEQWKRAMDYLNVVNELNYMTQIVIMLYEDPNKVTEFLILYVLLFSRQVVSYF